MGVTQPTLRVIIGDKKIIVIKCLVFNKRLLFLLLLNSRELCLQLLKNFDF